MRLAACRVQSTVEMCKLCQARSTYSRFDRGESQETEEAPRLKAYLDTVERSEVCRDNSKKGRGVGMLDKLDKLLVGPTALSRV